MSIVDEAKKLLEKISERPWVCRRYTIYSEKEIESNCEHEADFIAGVCEYSDIFKPESEANLEFIARSPELVSGLIKRVEELESKLQKVQDAFVKTIGASDCDKKCGKCNCSGSCHYGRIGKALSEEAANAISKT